MPLRGSIRTHAAEQGGQIVASQIANAFDGDVGRRTSRDDVRVVRVLPLPHEHGRHPLAPERFHRRQDAQLVIHHYVVARRVALLDVVQHLLLVNIDQHSTVDRVPQSGALDFARLENHIAIGQDDRSPNARRCLMVSSEPW